MLTNNELGAAETFEGLLPTFSSRETLRAALRYYLEGPELREGKVQMLRQFVLENHTYDLRAKQLLDILEENMPPPGDQSRATGSGTGS